MEPILEDFTARVRMVQRREPAIPFVSNLTGAWISPAEAIDSDLLGPPPAPDSPLLGRAAEGSRDARSILLELGPGRR
jgi:hypothetical protein